MTLDQFRDEMAAQWKLFENDAKASRDPNLATLTFGDWYAGLSDDRRALANQVLAEWVGSPDDGQQFDALAVIWRFKIRSALPAIERLYATLDVTSGPEPRFLATKLERVRASLQSPD